MRSRGCCKHIGVEGRLILVVKTSYEEIKVCVWIGRRMASHFITGVCDATMAVKLVYGCGGQGSK